MPKNKKVALKLGIHTYQILTNDDEVCIPSLSSILIAVALLVRYRPRFFRKLGIKPLMHYK